LELVHVPAGIDRGRGDEHGLAVAGLVLAGREVVPEVAREVPRGFGVQYLRRRFNASERMLISRLNARGSVT
jgi:hypothetical protein